MLARCLVLLREFAWTAARPEHRRVVAAQLERLAATVAVQDFDRTERAALAGLATRVELAVGGRW